MMGKIQNVKLNIFLIWYYQVRWRINVKVWSLKILDHFLCLFRHGKIRWRTRVIKFFLNKCKKIYTK